MSTNVTTYPIFQPTTRANPQAVYAQMREHDPIYRAVGPQTGNTIWFFTRYEDVVAVLRDQRFVKDARNSLPPELASRYVMADPDPTFEMINRHLLNLDAPNHTRLRSLVHKAFTPKAVRDLQPRIETIADELIVEMKTRNNGDLLDMFAFPLPITVIAEMIGVEKERRDDFRRWTQALLFGVDMQASQLSIMELVQYTNGLIEERRAEDKGDILSSLVRVEDDGDTLDHMEVISMVFLLLVAGHETTVNLIGNGMLALMQHPEQYALLKENHDLLPSAIEEILRYNGPVETTTVRFASEDIDVAGVTIPQGDIALPSLLAANRDPAIFEDPDRFDITRDPNPHVAFGQGIHYCLGAPLARMEGQIALQALLDHFPDMQLDTAVEDLEWNASLLLHGMKALPVRW